MNAGDAVIATDRGTEKPATFVESVTYTKGAWYTVKLEDGTTKKFRPVNVRPA